MVGLRKALAPDLFARENIFDVFRFLFVGAHIEQQRPNPVKANRVKNDRRVVLRQFLVDDVLIRGISALTSVLTGPVHAQVARAPECVLPLAQKIELLLGAHFQKSQWQEKAGVRRHIFRHPRGYFLAKRGQRRFVITHDDAPAIPDFVVDRRRRSVAQGMQNCQQVRPLSRAQVGPVSASAPAGIRACLRRATACSLESVLPGSEITHDFFGTAADGIDAHLAVNPFNPVTPHVTEAT